MNCPKCHAEVSDGMNFCPRCGEKIVTSCRTCGAKIKPGQKFCSNCGSPVEASASIDSGSSPLPVQEKPDLRKEDLQGLATRIKKEALASPDYLDSEKFFPGEKKDVGKSRFFFERWSSFWQVTSLAACAILLCTIFSYANMAPALAQSSSSSQNSSASSALGSLLQEDSSSSKKKETNGSSSGGTSAQEKKKATTLQAYAYDGSFTGARKSASSKGGYLVPLDSDAKLQKAISLAQSERDKGSDVVIYYVGGQREAGGSTYYQTSKSGSGLTKNPVQVGSSRWLSGEPSLVDLNNGADETVLAINYMKEYDRWYLNDVPESILTYSPEFSGKIGYIMEMEED